MPAILNEHTLTMKQTFLILTLSLISLVTFAQKDHEPQILILAPNNLNYDKAFENEIQALNNSIKGNINYDKQIKALNSKDNKTQPDNIFQMMKSEIEFSKNLDFYKTISFISEQFLSYRFFEKFPNLLILLKDAKSNGKLEELKTLAEQSKMQYVLNFPKSTFYKQNGESFANVQVQLYDNNTNSILIDTAYIGGWNNPGFEFVCQDSSLNCTINNVLLQALDNVVYKVAINSPTLKKERLLSKQRIETIRNLYLNKTFDKKNISDIISKNDSSINLNNLYQTFFSEDKTKFVAFFLEQVTKQNFKQLSENKQDKNITILNDKNIRDTGYLDNVPQTYAYIVKAVKYKEKWYYEKSEVTFFEPEDDAGGKLQYLSNLQRWNFFVENSISENPDFWETSLFNKIKDLRKDPNWNKYKNSIWKSEEEENRNYIGLYEIVADQLKPKDSFETKRIKMN